MIARARRFAVLVLLAGGAVCAQSTLPANSPTALPAASPQTSTTRAPEPAGRAVVVWSDGKLEITADNSSLNQILHEISRQTGMKITGGVTDERVFGKYGPGPPAEILASLLDGTGSNMLLRETATRAPAELILTARQGGPTPPNPNARGFDDDTPANEEPAQMQPQPNQGFRPPAPPAGMNPGAPGNAPPGVNPPGGADAGTTPSSGATNPNSPNGVQTPQQIFEQLQRMQRSQQQQQTNPQ